MTPVTKAESGRVASFGERRDEKITNDGDAHICITASGAFCNALDSSLMGRILCMHVL